MAKLYDYYRSPFAREILISFPSDRKVRKIVYMGENIGVYLKNKLQRTKSPIKKEIMKRILKKFYLLKKRLEI